MLGQVVNKWRCLKKPEIEDWLRLGAATRRPKELPDFSAS
jgi:hypothetical protein